MPVIAYLDAGIYCHPIVDGLVDAVKIGYYNPPDMPRERDGDRRHRRASSSSACPGCATPRSATSRTSTSATTTSWPTTTSCSAPIPGVAGAFVGVGWRGTGYKFAPWVGRVLAELALAGRHRLRPRPLRPGPLRRADGRPMSRPSAADPAAAPRRRRGRSAPRATSSSSSAAATSRPARTSRGDPRRARRAAPAAPRVPARGVGRDGRPDLLRAPRQAARTSAAPTTSRR